ncbi:MAG TPA: hypothetical protein VGF38_11275 [Ktedonobacterales bacterium]|jgi:tetratricopeptide (TPR) repeat protein
MGFLGRLFGKRTAKSTVISADKSTQSARSTATPGQPTRRVKELVATATTGKYEESEAAEAAFGKLPTQEKETAIPLIVEYFRKDPNENCYEASQLFKAVGTLAAFDPLLEMIRSVKQYRISETGELLKPSGEDGAPAQAMVNLPGGVARLKGAGTPEESERILVLAYAYGGSYDNADLTRALGELGTSKAIGCLFETLGQGHWPAERRGLAKDALIAAGKKAHPQLLQSLEEKIPSPDYRRSLRQSILDVLAVTGDEDCVPAITNIMRSDAAVTDAARATLQAIAARTPGMAVPEETGVQPRAVKQVASTGDSYVDNCFHVDFQEFEDTRDWYQMPEAKPIPQAVNAGNLDEALRLAQTLRETFPDFDYSYSAFAMIYRKQNRYDDARHAIEEGLQAAKQKSGLCSSMGDIEWQAGNLREAVPWWIKSIVLQASTEHPTEYGPFMYLSYVAEQLGLGGACSRLRDVVDSIRAGKIRLSSEGANPLYAATRREGADSMKQAIQILDSEYLKPILA